MNIQNRKKWEQIYAVTNLRLHLKEWENITAMCFRDDEGMVMIETYQVKVLVREDRYEAKGTRVLQLKNTGTRWYITTDTTIWDEDFTPYVFEKIGRRRTADELHEQREWEKMCYRPGNARTPLDSYDRVCDTLIPSTKRMEGHF